MANTQTNNDCIFCKIANKVIKADFIYESENLIVIKDINPQAPVHYLIITKKHIQDIQSMSNQDLLLGSEVLKTAQELSKTLGENDNFKLVNNNGYSAGQRVFHFHAHFLAKFTNNLEI